jgi:TRAP-type C4-dicarboxylate transport system permease small subunit
VWTGIQLVDLLQHQRSPALDVPIYYIYTALPLVSALMAIVVVYQIVARLLGRSELGQQLADPQVGQDSL